MTEFPAINKTIASTLFFSQFSTKLFIEHVCQSIRSAASFKRSFVPHYKLLRFLPSALLSDRIDPIT